MSSSSHEAETSIKTAKIETLEASVVDLNKRLETANKSVLEANCKVAEMAQSAL